MPSTAWLGRITSNTWLLNIPQIGMLCKLVCALLQELTENYISNIGWRQTKLSGWWEISSTFAIDIFGFFNISDGNFPIIFPFQRMEIPNFFKVFQLNFHRTGRKSITFQRFPIKFLFQRMEISNLSKFFSYIPFSKDGNPQS